MWRVKYALAKIRKAARELLKLDEKARLSICVIVPPRAQAALYFHSLDDVF